MRERAVLIVQILSVFFTLFSLYLVLGRHHFLLRLIGLLFLGVMALFMWRTGLLAAIGLSPGR
jgi:hypothetical protein